MYANRPIIFNVRTIMSSIRYRLSTIFILIYRNWVGWLGYHIHQYYTTTCSTPDENKKKKNYKKFIHFSPTKTSTVLQKMT